MKDIPYDLWKVVIGLEIHVQLNTKSKLFSPAPNSFGEEPNVNIDEICTGQPGALPVLNKEAVHKAILFGLAVNAKIEKCSHFDRKSYFYPDSPRNFQITQFEKPLIKDGSIFIKTKENKEKKITISSAHLEDDTGMLKHFSNFSSIDYNRAGAPLIEIVSKPEINSPKEAVAYATKIKSILEYIESSDCNMEKGHLRIDANVSVKRKDEKNLRTKVEIKNINSFSYLEKALTKEITRQISIYTENPEKDIKTLISQETYRWDSQKQQNILMREKESAKDYRYFSEPDIPPIIVTKEFLAIAKKNLPELPDARFKRYKEELNLSSYNASFLTKNKHLSDYFEKALQTAKNPTTLCNIIATEFTGKLKEKEKTVLTSKIPPINIAKLVNLIENKDITGKIAKKIVDEMIKTPEKNPEIIVKENPDFQPIKDASYIEKLVDKVILENPSSIKDYKNGKKRALSFLVGQVMKLTKGKASYEIVNKLILKKISEN